LKNFIITLITIALLLFFFSFFLIYDELIFAIRFVIYTTLVVVTIGGLIATISIGVWSYERYRKIKAERIELEKNANVMTVTTPNGQVFIRETDHKAWWRAAHLDNRVYANGMATYDKPSREERDNWLLYNKPTPKLIEGQITGQVDKEQPATFYDLLNDYPHLMLIGSTNSGKTTQIKSAIEYRLKQYPQAKLVWLSTHASLDSNLIPQQAIVFNQPETIAKALQSLFQVYKNRCQPGNYSQVILAMDEWPEIIEELKDIGIEAGDYLKRLSRGARKTNFSLILACHGATVSDLGTKGHSTVKRDFAEVYLDTKLTRQGKAVWQQFNKVSSRVEITLPPIVTMTEKQKEIVGMYNGGERNLNTIAQYVYSSRGGNQKRIVEETVSRFCS
jgi:hypothetical protein